MHKYLPINFDFLKEYNPALYQKFTNIFKFETGTHPINVNLIPRKDGNDVAQFHQYQTQREGSEQANRDEKARKKQADLEAGRARLRQYVVAQNLEDTVENGERIQEFLNEVAHGYVSQGNIDAAISVLGPRGHDTLTFKTLPPALPPAPSPPAPVILSDGSEQLPLDATEKQMRAATMVQLHDLAARQRAPQDPRLYSR